MQQHDTPDLILNNFINTVRCVVRHGDQVEFSDSKDWLDEDEKEEEYILDVFVEFL